MRNRRHRLFAAVIAAAAVVVGASPPVTSAQAVKIGSSEFASPNYQFLKKTLSTGKCVMQLNGIHLAGAPSSSSAAHRNLAELHRQMSAESFRAVTGFPHNSAGLPVLVTYFGPRPVHLPLNVHYQLAPILPHQKIDAAGKTTYIQQVFHQTPTTCADHDRRHLVAWGARRPWAPWKAGAASLLATLTVRYIATAVAWTDPVTAPFATVIGECAGGFVGAGLAAFLSLTPGGRTVAQQVGIVMGSAVAGCVGSVASGSVGRAAMGKPWFKNAVISALDQTADAVGGTTGNVTSASDGVEMREALDSMATQVSQVSFR